MERNEENEMLKLSEIDVNKCFIDDTVGFWDGFWERRNGLGAAPVYADPDSASETLRNYHQALWSRKLPNGEVMTLQKGKKSDYLTWNGMRFASDSIATQHRYGAYSNIVNVFNQMAYRGHDKKLWNLKCLETAYLHASYPRYVYVVAYKTYRKTKNKYTKEFLADRQKYVAKAIALEMEEKDFIDFVKLDFINLKYDADIVKCLEKQNWNVALAYILEEGKNNNNDAFVI